MIFATPFTVRNGIFHDRHFMPLALSCADVACPGAPVDLPRLILEGVNMLRVTLDDAALADAEGRFAEDALDGFDALVEDARTAGFYITLAPFSRGIAKGLDPALFTRQQRCLSTLFTRRSRVSGRRLYECDHVAAIEILFDPTTFSDKHLDLYCGRGMMEVFIDHYFSHRVVKICSLERRALTHAQRDILARHHIKLVDPDVFSRRNNDSLKSEMHQPGIPDAVVRGGIRVGGDSRGWTPIGIADCTSITEHAHANGGAEGWLTYAATGPVDLRLAFPVPVRKATFRPSMIEALDVRIDGCAVELTLPSPRYGSLEVNYDLDDAPAYTVHILGDDVAADPAESGDPARVKWVPPGIHAPDELACETGQTLCFLPGLHEIAGDKLPLRSNRDVHVARGAVVRAGIIAEAVEHAKILGQGVFDGSTSPRDVGENQGERMGEKWIEDAGREGFVCFYKGADIIWDGPVIYNSNYWNLVVSGTRNAVIRNHKAVTWLQNTDGVQPRSCTGLLVEHCFLKCADDCIAIKTRRTLAMESRDIVCRDLVLWHDRVGAGLQIGHTSQGDLLENILFQDVFAIYGGGAGYVLGMCVIDHETVRDVRYENIFVEGAPFGCDFGFSIQPTYYTTDDERGRITGVVVRNYRSEGAIHPNSHIKGHDPAHRVESLSFQDVYEQCGHPEKRRKILALSELFGFLEHHRDIQIS